MQTVVAVNAIITGIGATVDRVETQKQGRLIMEQSLSLEDRGGLLSAQIQSAFLAAGLVDAYFNNEPITIEMLEVFESKLALNLYPRLIPSMHQTVSTLCSLL